MGRLLISYLMPHPPIMVNEVGKGSEREIEKTIESAERVGEEIESLKPDTIVIVVPPHGPAFGDAMSIISESRITGNLGNFGAGQVSFDLECDMELTGLIIRNCAANKIPAVPVDKDVYERYGVPNTLDHGAMVPLYFVNKKYHSYKLVHITYGILSNEELYHFGRIIRESIEESGRNAVFIASGDLSHRLTHDAPAGYNPRGKDFDREIVGCLEKSDVDGVMNLDRGLIEAAGECGYRSILSLLGTLDGLDTESSVFSYEGPFGVGYCIAKFMPLSINETNNKVDRYFAAKKQKIENFRRSESIYVRLARESLEYYIKNKKILPVSKDISDELLDKRAGVFVSLKKNGELRGCIGTIGPVQGNIAEEIINNAVSAGTGDPRFYPVEADELDDLVYSVDVLGESEPIESKTDLDPLVYGVIVRKGRRSGLLLPNLEGVDTVNEQVSIALKKAGISEHEDYSMERFKVTRYR